VATTLKSECNPGASLETGSESPVEVRELVAFCPRCKTLEALRFAGDHLLRNPKFTQRRGGIYHDCGAKEPCRLYRFS
jgi:hypothetical protein